MFFNDKISIFISYLFFKKSISIGWIELAWIGHSNINFLINFKSRFRPHSNFKHTSNIDVEKFYSLNPIQSQFIQSDLMWMTPWIGLSNICMHTPKQDGSILFECCNKAHLSARESILIFWKKDNFNSIIYIRWIKINCNSTH